MENSIDNIIQKVKEGFESLTVDDKYKASALENIRKWLSDEEFLDYKDQIIHLVLKKDWDYLLDCFYQTIPFGTGGRRGEVGIGPNRINTWTIQASAQGHSQYLIKLHGEEAKSKGIVLAYGVREFFGNSHFSNDVINPVKNLKGKDLAESAAEVYTANRIKVFIFDDPRTTPELSFAIRYLHAIAGDMFDASHNPPEHNGKKVYDQFGGQLIPPEDELLVKEVTENVTEIKKLDLEKAKNENLLDYIGKNVDSKYFENIQRLSLSDTRNIKIIYTPLHGVGKTSIFEALKALGFDVTLDPETGYYSGRFENVTFNIPNPEVEQSFETTLKLARETNADIVLNSDPDADRIGVMVNHHNNWVFLNGNEIGAVLLAYLVEKKKDIKNGVIIKTLVTTDLAKVIAEKNNLRIINDLPVGFKYIADEMNKLEKEGEIDKFLFGLEESHGYIAGNYLRDKDGAVGAIWLANLAADLKTEDKTLLDYLNEVYSNYGYFRNYLTEVRLPGAEGMSKIQHIQTSLRKTKPDKFGRFEVATIEDLWDRKPIVSETDRYSKDVLVFHFKAIEGYEIMKVTVRPSGTEPKIKMYFELGTKPFEPAIIEEKRNDTEILLKEFEKSFMDYCYKIIGVDFPERGYLLFWQLPLKDKLRYFEIENSIYKLHEIDNIEERKAKLNDILSFLGSDPIEKVDKAFKEKYKISIKEI